MDNSLPVYYRLDYDELISLNGLNCSGEHAWHLLLSMLHRIDYVFNCSSFFQSTNKHTGW